MVHGDAQRPAPAPPMGSDGKRVLLIVDRSPGAWMTWLVRLCVPSQIDQRRQVIASSAQCLISRSPQQAGLAARNSVDLCAAARETKSISIARSPSVEPLMALCGVLAVHGNPSR